MTVNNKRAFVLPQNATIEPVYSAGITLQNNSSILISRRGFAYITALKAREHMEMMCFFKNPSRKPGYPQLESSYDSKSLMQYLKACSTPKFL